MRRLEKDICIRKKIYLDNDTTFKQVTEGHPLYDCVVCSGKPHSCPNYASYNDLMDSQYVKFKEDIYYNR